MLKYLFKNRWLIFGTMLVTTLADLLTIGTKISNVSGGWILTFVTFLTIIGLAMFGRE